MFNGRFYNKPGHLGMTRQQLKDALAGIEYIANDSIATPNITLSVEDVTTLFTDGTVDVDITVDIDADKQPGKLFVEDPEGNTAIAYVSAIKPDYVFYDYLSYNSTLNKTLYLIVRIARATPTAAHIIRKILD